MGRRETPISAGHDPVAELASQLRRLRADAGAPTYRSLAVRTHYSATTLSRAASGANLPSLDVVLAYARACGGDTAQWKQRWEQTSAALEADRHSAVVVPARRRRAQGRPGAAVVLSGVIAATVIAAALMLASGGLPSRVHSSGGQSAIGAARINSPPPTVSDGDDPRADGCASAADAQAAALGAREVAVRTVMSPGGPQIGWLALWRNARCGAEWAEASYANPHLYMVTLEVHRPADGATVVDHAEVYLPYDPVIGQLLTTRHGCVWAQMTLSIPEAAPIVVQTPCE
jgi:transcriptional regulator with XRE-family HTH domain